MVLDNASHRLTRATERDIPLPGVDADTGADGEPVVDPQREQADRLYSLFHSVVRTSVFRAIQAQATNLQNMYLYCDQTHNREGIRNPGELMNFIVAKVTRLFVGVALRDMVKTQEFVVNTQEVARHAELEVQGAIGSHGESLFQASELPTLK